MPDRAPDFVYVSYIAAPIDKVWNGLIDRELTPLYWKHTNESDWTVGSPWQHVSSDGSGRVDIVGKVLKVEAPRRLVISWSRPNEAEDETKVSTVTFELTPLGPDTKIKVIHSGLEPESDMQTGIEEGWPAVFCNLKTLLETGKTLSDEQWKSVEEQATRG
ncbi:MAG: GntR family transcriptional regulator [bacterium]|nr:GntR family transcriptional regulator [bacterium]